MSKNNKKRKRQSKEDEENALKRRKLDESKEMQIYGNKESSMETQENQRVVIDLTGDDEKEEKEDKKEAQNEDTSQTISGDILHHDQIGNISANNDNDNNNNNNDGLSVLNTEARWIYECLNIKRYKYLVINNNKLIEAIGSAFKYHFDITHGGSTQNQQKILIIVPSKSLGEELWSTLRDYVKIYYVRIFAGEGESDGVNMSSLRTGQVVIATQGSLARETNKKWRLDALKHHLTAIMWINFDQLETQFGHDELQERFPINEWSDISIKIVWCCDNDLLNVPL